MNITDATALWGALTGTIALVLTYANHKKDRPILSARFMRDAKIVSALGTDDKRWFSLTVANTGKRPITIDLVGFKLANGKNAFIIDKDHHGAQRIEENASHSWTIPNESIDKEWPYILHFWAKDAAGNIHIVKKVAWLNPKIRQLFTPQKTK